VVIPINVMQVNWFIRHQLQTTSGTCMVLLFERLRGFPVVEFTVPFTPIGQVPIVGRFGSPHFDELVFGVGDGWKCLSQQLFAGIAILSGLLVEHSIGSQRSHLAYDALQRINSSNRVCRCDRIQ